MCIRIRRFIIHSGMLLSVYEFQKFLPSNFVRILKLVFILLIGVSDELIPLVFQVLNLILKIDSGLLI